MPEYAALDRQTRAYAESVVDDAIAEGRTPTAALAELRTLLAHAVLQRDLPRDLAEPDADAIERLWRTRSEARAVAPVRALDASSLRSLDLGLVPVVGDAADKPLTAVTVRDVGTGCVTGLAVCRGAPKAEDAVRALHHSVRPKHGRGRRLPGCRHAWPCEGIPAALHAPGVADPDGIFLLHCAVLGIRRAPDVTGEEAWPFVAAAFFEALAAALPSGTAHPSLAAIEDTLVRCAVDTLNRRRHTGASPHELWLSAARPRRRRAPSAD